MDKFKAFEEINFIFNSIQNENISTSTKLEELRAVLDKLSKDSYENGIKNGLNRAIQIINDNI